MTHEDPKRGENMRGNRGFISDRASFVAFLFFLSGIPALIYQVSWQRRLVLLSGIGSQSVASIVASFMAGLGIGSLIGGRISNGRPSRQCLFWFALAEGAIGILGFLSSSNAFGSVSLPPGVFSGGPAATALAHLALLIVPTTLMGLTFPLLARALVRHGRRTSRVIGQLYALNLFGAAFGALMTPWVLFPMIGISGALVVASCVNGVVSLSAIGVWWLDRARCQADIEPAETWPEPEADATGGEDTPRALWYAMAFASGAIGIGLEIVWFRIVDIGAKATSFTFGTVLCVYLAGLGFGTLAGIRCLAGSARPFRTFVRCQTLVAVSAGMPVVLMSRWAEWLPYGQAATAYWARYEPISPQHTSVLVVVALYALFPMTLFFLPTFFMGMSFVALQDGIQSDRARAGLRLGRIQATNILGCILGSLGVGLYGFAHLGTAGTLGLLFGGFAVLFVLSLVVRSARMTGMVSIGLSAALILAMPGGESLWRRLHGQSPTARFFFAEDHAGVTSLIHEGGDQWRVSTNGKGQSRIPFGGVHSKLGALPATWVDRPVNVAIIGLGSGDTAWAAACREETRRIDVFEICDDQWSLLSEALAVTSDPKLETLLADDRIQRIAQDGRIALRNATVAYDLIEADAIRPDGAYAGNLYSIEFFRLCRDRLAPGGAMCTWNPTPRTLETFVAVFPYVVKLDGGQILIGSNEPRTIDPTAWRERLNAANVRTWLGERIVQECVQALDTVEILRDGGSAFVPPRINTDLFPRDEFHADRIEP